jgi:tetratricopeptide (TPR) repeat protein
MNLHTLAISHFNKYLYFYGEDPMAFYFLGESYLKIEDYHNAKLAFEKSHKLNSGDYRTLFYLGFVSQELSNYESAAKSYKKAIRINSDHSLSHYNLGISYLELGKKREAQKKLDILFMLDKTLYDSLNVRINSF